MKKKVITICCSASFYRQANQIKKELEELGFSVIVPLNARQMAKTGNYNVRSHKIWFQDKRKFPLKTRLMKQHFREIERSDGILVINLKKKGQRAYVGGNTLIEMALAFYLNKPIYLYRPVPKSAPYYEEVIGLNTLVINEDLSKLK